MTMSFPICCRWLPIALSACVLCGCMGTSTTQYVPVAGGGPAQGLAKITFIRHFTMLGGGQPHYVIDRGTGAIQRNGQLTVSKRSDVRGQYIEETPEWFAFTDGSKGHIIHGRGFEVDLPGAGGRMVAKKGTWDRDAFDKFIGSGIRTVYVYVVSSGTRYPAEPGEPVQVVGVCVFGGTLTWYRPPGTMKLQIVSELVSEFGGPWQSFCDDIVVEAGKEYIIDYSQGIMDCKYQVTVK
jgi:hypothetical protein